MSKSKFSRIITIFFLSPPLSSSPRSPPAVVFVCNNLYKYWTWPEYERLKNVNNEGTYFVLCPHARSRFSTENCRQNFYQLGKFAACPCLPRPPPPIHFESFISPFFVRPPSAAHPLHNAFRTHIVFGIYFRDDDIFMQIRTHKHTFSPGRWLTFVRAAFKVLKSESEKSAAETCAFSAPSMNRETLSMMKGYAKIRTYFEIIRSVNFPVTSLCSIKGKN